MSGVNEQIVREYLERQGFCLRTLRTHSGRGDEEMDWVIANPHASDPPGAHSFVLSNSEIKLIPRAVVAVKGWHTETFGAARFTASPDILRFLKPAVLAAAGFAPGLRVWKILVVPALPAGKAAREEAITFLKNKGVDAVLLFRTVLAQLVDGVEVNRNYAKSDLLQMIRILKKYDFLKDHQLELFKNRRKR